MADAGRPSSVVALQHWRHFPDRWLADVRDPDSAASARLTPIKDTILTEAETGQRCTVTVTLRYDDFQSRCYVVNAAVSLLGAPIGRNGTKVANWY